ncbi:IclR family transcriptional regulator domain-containing protein, partial [Salmonella enterica]|uniref:IclR family transcriptional regulator domain-containing protein n=1 Tax=Salmonella enterica TaxID=28901 RepID=UPI002ADEC66F
HREPFAALSISGTCSRITDDRVTELGAMVIKAAKEVTLAYGGTRCNEQPEIILAGEVPTGLLLVFR